MVQEEVADRIIAKPKTKDYGVLTIMCGLFGEAKKVLRVNRKKFYPVPNVDSAVVKIDKKNEEFNKTKFNAVIELVKKAFSMRRKKLSTNIENENFSKEDIENYLEENGFSRSARAEELSIVDFVKLYDVMCNNK